MERGSRIDRMEGSRGGRGRRWYTAQKPSESCFEPNELSDGPLGGSSQQDPLGFEQLPGFLGRDEESTPMVGRGRIGGTEESATTGGRIVGRERRRAIGGDEEPGSDARGGEEGERLLFVWSVCGAPDTKARCTAPTQTQAHHADAVLCDNFCVSVTV